MYDSCKLKYLNGEKSCSLGLYFWFTLLLIPQLNTSKTNILFPPKCTSLAWGQEACRGSAQDHHSWLIAGPTGRRGHLATLTILRALLPSRRREEFLLPPATDWQSPANERLTTQPISSHNTWELPVSSNGLFA